MNKNLIDEAVKCGLDVYEEDDAVIININGLPHIVESEGDLRSLVSMQKEHRKALMDYFMGTNTTP